MQGNVDQAIKWDADQRSVIVNRYFVVVGSRIGQQILWWPGVCIDRLWRGSRTGDSAFAHQGSASDTNVVIGAIFESNGQKVAMKIFSLSHCRMPPSVAVINGLVTKTPPGAFW